MNYKMFLPLVGAIAAAAPAAAEVVETREDGFVTRATANVAASPLEAWLALIKPGAWWNSSHTWSGDSANMMLTPQAGGCFCERVPGEDRDDGFSLEGSVQHMIVIQAYPLRVLRMRGGLGPLQSEPATGILTVTLKEIDGGTRVLWEYNVGGPMRYEIADISKAVDGVMSQQLAGLRDHLGALDAPASNGGEDAAANEAADPEREAPSIEARIDALAGEEG